MLKTSDFLGVTSRSSNQLSVGLRLCEPHRRCSDGIQRGEVNVWDNPHSQLIAEQRAPGLPGAINHSGFFYTKIWWVFIGLKTICSWNYFCRISRSFNKFHGGSPSKKTEQKIFDMFFFTAEQQDLHHICHTSRKHPCQVKREKMASCNKLTKELTSGFSQRCMPFGRR